MSKYTDPDIRDGGEEINVYYASTVFHYFHIFCHR